MTEPQLSILEITDKTIWEKYVHAFPEANFLQSWLWREFQEQMQKQVICLAVLSGPTTDSIDLPQPSEPIALALAIREPAKRGAYLSLPGGPLIKLTHPQSSAALELLFAELKHFATQNQVSFIRFRPQLLDTPESHQVLATFNPQTAPMHLTADRTIQLDLTQDINQLLAGMRKNTRYEVKRAEKLGITVRESTDLSDIKAFYEQQLWVAKKHNFVPFSLSFLEKQFSVFASQGCAKLFHAELDGKLLATAFIIFYNQEAVYHYGISTPENAKLPGAYACQWAAIQAAKNMGCTRYNLWGIAPIDQPHHRFAGVTIFKRGFGGTEVCYLPAQDIATHWSYGFTRIFELLRKKLRRL